MADISKITDLNGTTYDLKDAAARSDISDIQDVVQGFTVAVTLTSENGGYADKTIGEVLAAYEAGCRVIFEGAFGSTTVQGLMTTMDHSVIDGTDYWALQAYAIMEPSGDIYSILYPWGTVNSTQIELDIHHIEQDVPSPSDSNPAALGTASPGSSSDYSRADHVHAKPTAAQIGAVPGSGTNFRSGNQSNAEHNANNMVENGVYYCGNNQNGPPVSLGVQNADSSIRVQAYSDQWVVQLAQDYRDGQIFVRAKKQGVWQSWYAVPMFTTTNGAKGSATQPLYVDASGMLQPTTYTLGSDVPANAVWLPSVSASDNGKFLRVENGAWAAVTIPNANGQSF